MMTIERLWCVCVCGTCGYYDLIEIVNIPMLADGIHPQRYVEGRGY
jgi:hypothetical protein